MTSLSIRKLVTKGIPALPYAKIAEKALPGWELSLVFAGKARATSLNKTLRRKSYAPNVLSFSVGKKSGEIIICPEVAKKQHAEYGMTYQEFIAYLFIHGCLHLKGHTHGTTMERRERVLLSYATHLHEAKDRHRN